MANILRIIRQVWFAARKMRLPIPKNALVLEVGSGDSPCPRADVLLDATLENHERVGGRTVIDRPIVLGLVERLPFRNKAFDYVIAFHVLEHSPDPKAFLTELQRVASAGYIETPSFWAERVNPLTMHRLEVGLEPCENGSRLVISKKSGPAPDPELARQFDRILKNGSGFNRLDPAAWVTQYAWKGHIDFRILNPEVRIEWQPPPEVTREDFVESRTRFRRFLKWAAQKWHRDRGVDLMSLLRCVDCGDDRLEGQLQLGRLGCANCGRTFVVVDGIPQMHPVGWRLRQGG